MSSELPDFLTTPPGPEWARPIRKLSSHYMAQFIERSSSEFNPSLEVWYVSGHYELNTKRVNYSFGNLDTVFRETFEAIELDRRTVHSILVLGLGAGNIPAILQRYSKDYVITGVEIDPEVIRLGKQYFGLERYSNLSIVNADAIQYVETCNERFDLIAVDLFVDDQVPEAAEQRTFLKELGNLLEPEGILLYNRLMMNDRFQEQTEAFTRVMQEALPGTRYFKAYENRMLCYERKG